ncbi:RNA polymerase sigma-I factor [Oceanobacillus halotolerans]|uniref:RNA polymerase sigma-I factor n=1 Tax=Oceanobacillus halotolerans TaxID=2663380 RepID=UPI0013D8F2FB|nr:RNA polymerase sigma-I factor [Oceanobacillus halotolerans]
MMASQPLEEMKLHEMVFSAQQGDQGIQNYLLKTYQPFIAKCVSEVCKRYIDPKRDDEYSIGLFAFNEAILAFSPDKGSSFLSFAKLVIKRKVIDYIRQIKRYPVAVSIDEELEEERMNNPSEINAVREQYYQEQDAWYRKQEILDYQQKLRTYKLSLEELTKISPKHKDARKSAIQVAKQLFDDPELKEYVERKKKLPIKVLASKVDVSKKTLERNRKFILALFIVLNEDYVYLKDYLKGASS